MNKYLKKIIILVIIGVAETVYNSYFYLNVNKNENEKYVDKVSTRYNVYKFLYE